MIEILTISFTLALIILSYFILKKKQPEVKPEIITAQLPQLPQLFIYYASQTGTAAKFAEQLAQEALSHKIFAKVVDVADFGTSLVAYQRCIFLAATHGEGEPTDNSKEFVKTLETKVANNERLPIFYSMFGLGNTSYKYYNANAKNINNMLQKLGGKCWFKYGEGDDSCTLELDFENWKEKIWQEFNNKENFVINESAETVKEEVAQKVDYEYEFHTKNYLQGQEVKIVSVKELKEDPNCGSCLEIMFEGVQYKTAQNMAIYPRNSKENVEDVCNILKVDANSKVRWPSTKLPFPLPITHFEAISQYCDLQSILKKKVLKDLSQKCQDENQRKNLELLSSLKGKQEYEIQILQKRKTLLEIIKENNISLTFEEFINICGRITPRLFTISSSHNHSALLRLTCSIEQYTINNTTYTGLASQYFQSLQNSLPHSLRVGIRDSGFNLPEQEQAKIVMIGAGAGIAPFIGFLEENRWRKNQGKRLFELQMYFGCRKENGDYLYKKELKEFLDQNVLTSLKCAFSRDQSQKVYVQDLIQQDSSSLYSHYTSGGYFYVCGSLEMGRGVNQALEDIIRQNTGEDQLSAKAKVDQMEKERKLVRELWG